MKTIKIKLNIHDENFVKYLGNYSRVSLNNSIKGLFANGLFIFNKEDAIPSKGIIEEEPVFAEGLYKNLEDHIDEEGEPFSVETTTLLSSFYEII